MKPGAVALLLVAVSGCVWPGNVSDVRPVEALTLILDYALEHQGSEWRSATPGGHCASVYIENGVAHVSKYAMQNIGNARPILIVDPTLEGKWSTIGSEALARKLPHMEDPQVDGEASPLGRIGWIVDVGARGWPTVNDERVELPHSWSVATNGWRADLELRVGPSSFDTYDPGLCD